MPDGLQSQDREIALYSNSLARNEVFMVFHSQDIMLLYMMHKAAFFLE